MAKVKKGDSVIVKLSRNGCPMDEVMEITSVTNAHMGVKTSAGMLYNIYLTGTNKDEWIMADRPARLVYAKEKVNDLREELAKAERDVDILTNYESDEAYTAMKLSEILKAKDDPKAIEKLLKELKTSSYL
jgi:hypothetical protein